MSGHIYKMLEIVGSSTESIEDAIKGAVAKAGETVRNLQWFEVMETRGQIENGEVAHFQVHLRIGFTLE